MFSIRRHLPTFTRVFRRNVSLLSTDIQKEIKKLLKAKDSVAVAAFLQLHCPHRQVEKVKPINFDADTTKTEAGLTQGFMELFYKERAEHFETGLRLLRCIRSSHPQAYRTTLLTMISNLMTEGDIAYIILCLNDLHKASLQLDIDNQERIVVLLCRSMNIRLTRDVLTRYPITGPMLVAMSEPFIMAGYVKTYAEFLGSYLNGSSRWDYASVYDILCSILQARLRRSLTRSPLNASEKEGIRMITTVLEAFQKRHLMAITEHTDQREATSFRKCLYVVAFYLELTLSWAGDQPLPINSEVTMNQFRSQLGKETLPFLVENRTVEDWDSGSNAELPISSHIRDLTAQLAHTALVPLYNARLFPRSFAIEAIYAATIIGQMKDDFDDLNDMDHFEDGDIDEDDVDDEDFDEDDYGDEDDEDHDDNEFEGIDEDDEIDGDSVYEEYMTQAIDLDEVAIVDFDFDLDDLPESQHRSLGGTENRRLRIQDFTNGLQHSFHQARISFADEFFASRGSIKRLALRPASTEKTAPDMPPAPDNNGSGGTVGADVKPKRSIRDVVDKDP